MSNEHQNDFSLTGPSQVGLRGLQERIQRASDLIGVRWRKLTLAQQFLATAILPISCNTLILGVWMSYQVSMRYINSGAAASALYIESFIDPLVEELTVNDELTSASKTAISELAKTPPFSERIAWFKIWSPQGRILYSNNPDIVGRTFPLTRALRRALAGDVVPKFNEFDHEGESDPSASGHAYLEIYVPVRIEGSDRVVAVAEIYQIADQLARDLLYIRLETWAIVTGLSLMMTAVLFVIVARGSSTILRQRSRLSRKVAQLSAALDRVRTLNAMVDQAQQRSTASTERYIRRIGSDLHDGPAQQIGLAMLLIERLETGDAPASHEVAAKIDGLLSGALQEIRGIAAGLTTPELDDLSIEDALLLVAEKHEWKTGTEVVTSIVSTPTTVPTLMKIGLFRFAQEGLNNAFKHGGGVAQTLTANYDGLRFVVEVADSGGGFPDSVGPPKRPRLGLAIMRDRIESLNGIFEIESRIGGGTVVRASFNLTGEAREYGGADE